MFEWLAAKLISAPIIGAILQPVISGLLTAQKQSLDAVGSHEAVAADLAKKAFDVDQKEAEVNASIIIAEQGNWVTRSIRPLLGLPAAILTWKILVWDLALGQWTNGSTDKLSPQAFWLLTTIIIAYMGGRSAENIATKIAGIWKK